MYSRLLYPCVRRTNRFSLTLNLERSPSFPLTVMVVAILVFVFIPREPLWWLITSSVVFIPAIAALAYELIRFSGRYEDNPLVKIISAPNLLPQKLTTRCPDDDQIEVAATAMRTAWRRTADNCFAL